MTDLRTAAQQALDACTDAVSGWQSLAPLAVRRAAEAALDDLRAALVEDAMQRLTDVHQEIEADLSHCPKCGGPADNGHDRSIPPSPYFCTKCMAEPVQKPQRKPLTNKEIDRLTYEQWGVWNYPLAAHRAYARAIERAHGIGGQP